MDAARIKKALRALDKKRLASLLAELANFKEENEVWLETKLYGPELDTSLRFYRKKIKDAFFGKDAPDLKLARAALNDYKKVSSDTENNADLMMFYIETGTDLTLRYGDMWNAFYTSLENVYIDVLKTLSKPENVHLINAFEPRLQALVAKTEDMGWGYHDTLVDYYEEYIGKLPYGIS